MSGIQSPLFSFNKCTVLTIVFNLHDFDIDMALLCEHQVYGKYKQVIFVEHTMRLYPVKKVNHRTEMSHRKILTIFTEFSEMRTKIGVFPLTCADTNEKTCKYRGDLSR